MHIDIFIVFENIVRGFCLSSLVLFVSGKKDFYDNIRIRCIFTIVWTIYKVIAINLLNEKTANVIQPVIAVLLLTFLFSRKDYIQGLSLSIISYGIYLLLATASSFPLYFIGNFIGIHNNDFYMLSMFLILLAVLTVVLLFVLRKHSVQKLIEKKPAQYFVIACGVITMLAIRGFATVNDTEMDTLNFIFFGIILVSVILIFIWLKDRNDHLNEVAIIEEDVKAMSTKVHKTKEIFPALSYELGKLSEAAKNDENLQSRMEQLQKEVEQLSNDQREEDQKEPLLKLFETGSTLLNSLLGGFVDEAQGKKIEFDVHISTPLTELVKTVGVRNLELQRLIGDISRNAIRAIERKGEDTGNIYFCGGYTAEGFYSIDIHDDGQEFPIEIYKQFGKRGATTGGTGNGIHDVLDTINKYNASMRIIEYAPGTDLYTKSIMITFDGENELSIESYRYEELEREVETGYIFILESVV